LNKIQNIDYLGTSKIEVSPYVHKAIHILYDRHAISEPRHITKTIFVRCFAYSW